MKDKVLYIDDEQANLDGFFFNFDDIYDISTALSPYEAIEILKKENFKVIISDQRMPGMTGIDFFANHKYIIENAILIILTAFSEADELMEAINKAGIYRYILKPWDANDLKITINSAINTYDLKNKNKQLVDELELKNNKLIKALERAKEADRLKSTFINNISHEIRTPLNGIMGFVNIIKTHKKPEALEKYLDIIHDSSYRLFRIIDDILEFSILINEEVEIQKLEFSINDLLKEIHEEFKDKTRTDITFTLVEGQKLPLILSNEIKLSKVISKLLDNAFKYTQTGKISFGLLNDPNNQSSVTIFVRDSGIGISKEFSPNVFEAFSQEEFNDGALNEGNGLSLAICKNIISSLNGDIQFESEKGKGSTFYIKIPIK